MEEGKPARVKYHLGRTHKRSEQRRVLETLLEQLWVFRACNQSDLLWAMTVCGKKPEQQS